jgi:hypothetical protein
MEVGIVCHIVENFIDQLIVWLRILRQLADFRFQQVEQAGNVAMIPVEFRHDRVHTISLPGFVALEPVGTAAVDYELTGPAVAIMRLVSALVVPLPALFPWLVFTNICGSAMFDNGYAR